MNNVRTSTGVTGLALHNFIPNPSIVANVVADATVLPIPMDSQLNTMSSKDLKILAKAYKLKSTGKKDELITLLISCRSKSREAAVEDEVEVEDDEHDIVADDVEGEEQPDDHSETGTALLKPVTDEDLDSFGANMSLKYKNPYEKTITFDAAIYDPKDLQECRRLIEGTPEVSRFRIATWFTMLMGFDQQAASTTTAPAATTKTKTTTKTTTTTTQRNKA